MTKDELRQFVKDWMAGFIALLGLFLIYKDVTLIGVLIYGVIIHAMLVVYFNTIYDDNALERFLERVKAKRGAKSWLNRQLGRLQLLSCFAISLYVLAVKGRWYLFAVTCAVIILGAVLVKIVWKDLRGSKMVIGG